MDSECGVVSCRNQPGNRKVNGSSPSKKLLFTAAASLCLLLFLFGVFTVHCEHWLFPGASAKLGDVAVEKSQGSILADGSAEDPDFLLLQPLKAHEARSYNTNATEDGYRVPISTQTELQTIYSVSHPPDVTTLTRTTTEFVSVPVPVSSSSEDTSSSDVCGAWETTVTNYVTITQVEQPPTSESTPLGDATVIGNPSTVTDVDTDVSFTSGLSDATVSGNPSTFTEFQTDVSVTSGLGDATVSGAPGTVTNVETDYSITSGSPDATVSGSPLTVTKLRTTISISDLWGTDGPPASTVTAVVTAKKTVTIYETPHVTITEGVTASSDVLAATPSTPVVTVTEEVTTTLGPAATSTTTVEVLSPPLPSINTTIFIEPPGTISVTPLPSTPIVVVSGSGKNEVLGHGSIGVLPAFMTLALLVSVAVFLF